MHRKKTGLMLWDKKTSEFPTGTTSATGGRVGSDKRNWSAGSLKYLLGSLSPAQPHHCLLPAFVSITDSPAHLHLHMFGLGVSIQKKKNRGCHTKKTKN